MKRTCSDCKALCRFELTCTLGYKVEGVIKNGLTDIAPTEKCPKPTTYTNLNAMNLDLIPGKKKAEVPNDNQ